MYTKMVWLWRATFYLTVWNERGAGLSRREHRQRGRARKPDDVEKLARDLSDKARSIFDELGPKSFIIITTFFVC